MKCSVVKELLPNYINGLTSNETGADIKKHLTCCESCRAVYEYLLLSHTSDIMEKEKEAGLTQKKKSGMQKRTKAIAVACVALAVGILFLRRYNVPIPYDANRMFIEKIPSVFAVDKEYGWVYLTNLDGLDFQDSKSVLSGNLDVMDMAWFTYRGIHNAGFWSKGRTIKRNGQTVRVIYYRYTKSLWDLLLPSDLFAYSESASNCSQIYSDSPALDGEPHVTELREIYYLPLLDLDELDELSDEEYDAVKDNASLVWSGVN